MLSLCLPQELEQLQHDVSSVTSEAQHEKELVEQELERLSDLVLHFQQRIARVSQRKEAFSAREVKCAHTSMHCAEVWLHWLLKRC